MREKLSNIVITYRERDRLLPEYQATSRGLWASSIMEDVFEVFLAIGLGKFRRFADLGSGDGRVVAIASLFTMAAGYEVDADLVRQSLAAKEALGLDACHFFCADFLTVDFSAYDILYSYPDKPLDELEQHLGPGWHGHLLIGGPHFPPRRLVSSANYAAKATKCTLYQL